MVQAGGRERSRGRRGDDAAIRQQWGGLDILVNNAGILRDRSIAQDERRGVAVGASTST